MFINIKLVIAYSGTHYLGWQKTNMGPSIEEALERALVQVLQHAVKLQAASRTDAGVHAEGQVVNFFLQKPFCLQKLVRSLNGVLPKDISVASAEEMPPDFHPTLDCIKKEYRYQICTGKAQLPFYRTLSWPFPSTLNLDAMVCAAQHLLGRHDFSTFCNALKLSDKDPICHLEKIEIFPLAHERLEIAITGDRFLYRMVRNLVGTLVYVGYGKLQSEAIPAILASKERIQAGVTAPAGGLVLKTAFYKNIPNQKGNHASE